MKRILIVCVGLLRLFTVNAENRVNSTVKEVTVYLNGAKLMTTATVKVEKGTSEVIFENLSPDFYAPSLQVKLTGDAKLLSAKFRSHYPETPKLDPRVKIIQDSMVILGDILVSYADEKDVIAGEENMIKMEVQKIGTVISGPSGTVSSLSMTEMKEMLTFYRTRILEIKNQWRALGIKERKMNQELTAMRQRISNIASPDVKITGEVALQINSNTTQEIEISCIYLITSASWVPMYDISSEGTEKPVKLTYRGGIRQNSGFDWKNVTLKLSTSNPFLNNSRPILNPAYINYRVYYGGYGRERDNMATISAAPTNTYNLRSEDEEKSKEYKSLADSISLGLYKNGPNKITKEESVQELLNNTNAFSVLLDVPLQHSISANGEEHIVEVETHEIKAQYQYHAVPKLESSVFLLAKITDYGQYNLMPGNANIFYQNTLIGQSFIDPKTVADTLLLSFGRDENITIKRVKAIDVTSAKIIGMNRKETMAFDITVKNNKKVTANIEILDQIPISQNAEIVVEAEDLAGAEYVKDYGKLLWRVNVPANSSKKIRFSYTIKYPKDKQVDIQ